MANYNYQPFYPGNQLIYDLSGNLVGIKNPHANGADFIPGVNGQVIIAAGKTFTVNNTLTLAGTDGTTLTFPATSATIARTDAAQTFTGNNVNVGTWTVGNGAFSTVRPYISSNSSSTWSFGASGVNFGIRENSAGADLVSIGPTGGIAFVGAASTTDTITTVRATGADAYKYRTSAGVDYQMINMGIDGSSAYLQHTVGGAGTQLPFWFYVGGTARLKLTTTGTDATGAFSATGIGTFGTNATTVGSGASNFFTDATNTAIRAASVGGATYFQNSTGGTNWGNISSTGLAVTGQVSATTRIQPPSFTVGTLPSAATAGGTIYVTDAAVAPCIAFTNGTNWKRCDNAATTVV